MNKIKIMTIIGTRPEGIKMGPVIKKLAASGTLTPIIVSTGQHHAMLQPIFKHFKIKPDYDLRIMKANQTLANITTTVINRLTPILEKEQPQMVLVHGDTSSAYAAALAAFYQHISIGHVEAGLRTWNKNSPFPEEMNRQMIDNLADLYFAPTETSASNLIKENKASNQIFITGNTAIDALYYTIDDQFHHQILDKIPTDHRIILLTMHRRENLGQPMIETLTAIRDVISQRPNLEVIFPAHLNPKVQTIARQILDNHPQIHLINPQEMTSFQNLMNHADLIMTDSGGIQEEAPTLHKPVLVLRNTTERPEGVTAGTLKLIGTQYEQVVRSMVELLDNPHLYQKMATANNPYGDGHASERIVNILNDHLRR